MSCLLSLIPFYHRGDQLVRVLLTLSGLKTKSWLTPRSGRPGTSNRCLTFTTTMRMVVGVHDGTANGRSPTHMSLTSSLTDLNKAVVSVTNGTDGCTANDRNHTHFARRKAKSCISVFLSHQLSAVTSGTNKLSALTGIELDVVDFGTNRDVLKRKAVTYTNFCVCCH